MTMTPTITIYTPGGDVRLEAHIGRSSKREFTLMEKDQVSLDFTIREAVILHPGDWIGVYGNRYELVDTYKPDQSANGYSYKPVFQAQYRKFANKLMKLIPGVGAAETSWTYTDSIEGHLRQILENMNALANEIVYDDDCNPIERPREGGETYLYNCSTPWSAEVTFDDSMEAKMVTMQYQSTNILDAISHLAEQYEAEWWFEDNILRIGKCQKSNRPVTLRYGSNVCKMSRSDSSESKATKLFIYGSDKNLASTYRKILVFTQSGDGEQVYDVARELKGKWFLKDYRVMDSRLCKTLRFISDKAVYLDRRGEHVIDTVNMEFTPENTGAYTIDLSNLRPSMIAATMTPEMVGKVRVKAIFSLDVTRVLTDNTVKHVGTYTSEVDARHGLPAYGDFGDEKVAPGSFKTLRCVLTWKCKIECDDTGSFSEYVTLSPQESRAAIVSIVADDMVYGATNITVEVLDRSGKVARSINGCTFNPDFTTDNPVIKLPGGNTLSRGSKYTIPELNAALVPASYYSNKYSVIDRYTDIATRSIVIKRLMLPETEVVDGEEVPLKGYLLVGDPQYEEEAIEDVVTFEEVYPKVDMVITEVEVETKPDTQEEQDGSVTDKDWPSYSFRCDIFNDKCPFNEDDYLIPGRDFEMKFIGVDTYEKGDVIPDGKNIGDPKHEGCGHLTGMTFKVGYLGDNLFEIQRETNIEVPNEYLKPAIGDKFIFLGFNIAMLSDKNINFVGRAEEELLKKGREYADKLNTDANVYNCTLHVDWAKEHLDEDDGLSLSLGQKVTLFNPAYFQTYRVSRIIGWEVSLALPYDNPTYIAGEKAKYSRLGEIDDKIEDLQVTAGILSVGGYAGGSGAGTGGAGPYVIKRDDPTPPKDTNVYSALRSRREFLSKLSSDTAAGRITFAQGLESIANASLQGGAHFGRYVQGYRGGAVDSQGNAEFESITARSFLKVYELIYNRINALEGNTSFADSGTIERIEQTADNAYTLTMRKRWDGDFTAFQPNDIVYGYVNELDSPSPTYHKAWGRVASVDRANNTIAVVMYPPEECPGDVNNTFAPNMVISRWGNATAPDAHSAANPAFSSFIYATSNGYVNKRQQSFYISCEDGNIIELMGVNKPKLDSWNYGAVLGQLPAGLIPPDKAGLINEGQPYLYARGIVVQDLIRIDYNGVQMRTPNYRGSWSAIVAESDNPYQYTDSYYDMVTHNGSLWQCVVSGTLDEPAPLSSAWVMMNDTAELSQWHIYPSADVITVRDTAVTPASLGCSVQCIDSYGETMFTDSYTLGQRGAHLMWSADGSTFHPFEMGLDDFLETEDNQPIQTEEGEGLGSDLSIGGDTIDAALLADRVVFELRENDTDTLLARSTVPVVRDGAKGEKGDDGMLAYPAGFYDPSVVYKATGSTKPVVQYGIGGEDDPDQLNNFYVLRTGMTYCGNTVEEEERNTPEKDCAIDGGKYWELVDRFSAIYTDILFADFAKIGSMVVYGHSMISQEGILYKKEETVTAGLAGNLANATASQRYQYSVNNLSAPESASSWSATLPDFESNRPYLWAYTQLSGNMTLERSEPVCINPDGKEVCEVDVSYARASQLVVVDKNRDEGWSESGTTDDTATYLYVRYKVKHPDSVVGNSTDYRQIKEGRFRPNYQVDFKTGAMRAGNVEINGSMMRFFGDKACNIEIGVNNEGYAVLRYYDNQGVLLYDLGPRGISKVVEAPASWDDVWIHQLTMDASVSEETIVQAYATAYKMVPFRTSNHHYRFRAAYIVGQPIDDADGKVFPSQSTDSGGITGWYCDASASGTFEGYAQMIAVGGSTSGEGKSTTIYKYEQGILITSRKINW